MFFVNSDGTWGVNESAGTLYKKNKNSPYSWNSDIYFDKTGYQYYEGNIGLTVSDSISTVSFNSDDGMPSGDILSFVLTDDGVVWVGANNGLAKNGIRYRAGRSGNRSIETDRIPFYIQFPEPVQSFDHNFIQD